MSGNSEGLHSEYKIQNTKYKVKAVSVRITNETNKTN